MLRSCLVPQSRREAADQAGDLVGDLRVLSRVRVPVERIDRQVLLDQPDVLRAGLAEELGAVLPLLRAIWIVLEFALRVREHEADARVWAEQRGSNVVFEIWQHLLRAAIRNEDFTDRI